MSAQDLSALLWRERELLELLTFKLEEEQLLLTAGKTKWLPHATREVEQVMDRLREAGLGRSIAVSGLAKEWGTDENATLRELVAHAPLGPWSDIFTAHLQAMTDLAGQIKQLRDTNEQFLRAAARSTQETLARLNVEAGTYDAHGTAATDVGTAHLVDRSL